MRVVFVNRLARFQGGVERVVARSAAGLRQRGHHANLLALEGPIDDEFAESFSDIAVASGNLHDALRRAQNTWRADLLFAHKVGDHRRFGWHRLQTPTLWMLHDHDLWCQRRHRYLPGSLRACDRRAGLLNCAGCGLVVERSSGPLGLGYRPVWQRLAELQAARTGTTFALASQYMTDEAVRHGLPWGRVRTVPLGVPDQSAVPAIAPAMRANEMLYVGQVVRTKGLDVLLRAIAEVPEARLRVVGVGPQLDEFRALARTLGVDNRVQWSGRLGAEEVHRAMSETAAVVMPGRWPEPFGLVGVEGMRAAKPVVASATGGVTEWLRPDVTGMLVPPGEAGGLAQAIAALVRSPRRAEELGRAGRQRYLEQFTESHYLDRLEETLEWASSLPRAL